MRYGQTILNALCVSILFSSVLYATDPILEITQPKQEAVVHDEALVTIVVAPQHEGVKSVIMTTDTNKTVTFKMQSSRSHYCYTFQLHLGDNNITISAIRDGKIMKAFTRRIFVTSKVDKAYRYAPDEYQRSFFHTKTQEKVCAKCHDMSVNEMPGVAFEDVSKSNCFGCHVKINFKKYAHAPSVNWLCTECHNGKTGSFNEEDANLTRFSVPDPIGPVCLHCHEKKEKLWKNKRYHHEPADSGRCNKCHNPHASNNLNYLRKPAWELCTGCHKDKIDGGHVVKTFGRKMHPTHKVKDPSRKGNVELSCVSCHNPHVSNAPFMLQSDSLMSLCGRCHKK